MDGDASTKQGSKKEEFDPNDYVRNGLTEEEVIEIKEAFDLFDTKGSGYVNASEVKLALQNCGIDSKNRSLMQIIEQLKKKEK